MEFLDSLDLDLSYKRSRRVRCWYLYEQFKSLEKNQLDATRKLKDRSYQEKILQQELSERRARRKFYNDFGICQSEPRIRDRVKSEGTKTDLSASIDDFFESFNDLLKEDECLKDVTVHDYSDACSQDDSRASKFYEDDFKSVDEYKDDNSRVESVNSVVNVDTEETLTDDVQKDNELEKEHKFEEININFDEVRQNLERLTKLIEVKDDDKMSEDGSVSSIETNYEKEVVMKDKNVNTCDSNVFLMWSRLVSFAYRITQLSHGNCYYDYGSQFLTAVLACDVLRRGINRMCHILQPYVSPIKYATDSECSTDTHKTQKKKKKLYAKRSKKSYEYKKNGPTHKPNRLKLDSGRKYRSENSCDRKRYSYDNRINDQKYHSTSEPRRSGPRLFDNNKACSTTKSSYNSIWPDFSNELLKSLSKEMCKCGCHKVVNPMLELSRYLDRIMRDIDDSTLL